MPPNKIFTGCVITLGPSIPISEKSKLNSQVRKHGGGISAFLNDNTTHYLCHEWDKKSFQSDPRRHKILHISFLTDSVEQGERCDEQSYALLPHSSSSETALFQSLSKQCTFNIKSVEHMITHYKNEQLKKSKKSIQPAKTSYCPTPHVNQSLKRIQETMQKREAKKLELQKPIEVAAIDLPTFDFHILSENFDSIEEGLSLNEFPRFSDTDTESISSGASDDNNDMSWISLFNEQRVETIKQEKERYRQEERERREARKKEEQERKIQIRLKKKETIRKNIARNAEEGRAIQLIKDEKRQKDIANSKEQCEKEQQAKADAWEAEQTKRRLEWEEKKKKMKEERNLKKKRFQEQKKRILEEDQEEKGRKLFVGKASFDDILEDDSCNEFLKEELMDARKREFVSLFERYGHVDKIKPSWEKKFFFVIYAAEEEAQLAIQELTSFDERKKVAASIRQAMKKSLADVRIAPLPTFYVRWPA